MDQEKSDFKSCDVVCDEAVGLSAAAGRFPTSDIGPRNCSSGGQFAVGTSRIW